jgi:hypothetical protein
VCNEHHPYLCNPLFETGHQEQKLREKTSELFGKVYEINFLVFK